MEELKRILYAEDNENDIELTLAAFKESNLMNPIDIVRDGEEALDYLNYRGKYEDRKEEVPAFILLDLKMPKLDGLDVLREIRSQDILKNIPVIILTSSKMESDIVQSYELGVNGFVVKPIDFNDFFQAIKTIGYFWAILNKAP